MLRRVYALRDLPRLKDVLAAAQGALNASFSFTTLPSGAAGAAVSIEASPQVVCQRCLQPFGLRVSGGSDVEFAAHDAGDARESLPEREFFEMRDGWVSLKDLAEEELLLALPIAPACATPLTCGKAPGYVGGDDASGAVPGDARRPFSALRDLLKKT